MTTTNEEHNKKRIRDHEARIRLFQILCALESIKGGPLSQAEIESRFEELFVLPEAVPGEPSAPPAPDNAEEDEQDKRVSFEEFRSTCAKAADVQSLYPEADGLIERYSTDWKAARMTLVDRTIIRLALYEALIVRSVPVSVALSEAVLIAKEFGGADSARFVNGVLARIARAVEQ